MKIRFYTEDDETYHGRVDLWEQEIDITPSMGDSIRVNERGVFTHFEVKQVRWNKFKCKHGFVSEEEVDILLEEIDEDTLSDWDNQE